MGGERLWETNRVTESRGGDSGRIQARGRVMGGKQEQLVRAGVRQRLVSGSERGNTRWAAGRYVGAGIRGRRGKKKKADFLFHFKALLELHRDTILTFLISLHLSSSDPHLFSLFYSSSTRMLLSVFPLFSPNLSSLLAICSPFR